MAGATAAATAAIAAGNPVEAVKVSMVDEAKLSGLCHLLGARRGVGNRSWGGRDWWVAHVLVNSRR